MEKLYLLLMIKELMYYMNKKLSRKDNIIRILGGFFMTKIVAVQNGLNDIKKELEDMGYIIVDMDSEDAEAIIYMRPDKEIPYISSSINMNTKFDFERQSGAILINAEGRTIEDIDRIIKNRIYTPLF